MKLRNFAAAACIAFAALASAARSAEKHYKIGVVPWAGWGAAHVAQAKGFWADQEVNAKLFMFPDTQAMISAMEKKLIDFSFDMVGSVVGQYLKGNDFVVLAETDWSNGGDKIVLRQDANLAETKGKFIGVYMDAPSVNFFLNRYLQSQGMQLSDFRIVEMPTGALTDKFIAGLFAGIVSYDPDALRAERDGKGKVVCSSASFPGCIPEGIYARRDTLVSFDKADVVKLLKGIVRGAEWIHDPANWAEFQTILNESAFAADGPYSEADLKEMIDAVAIHDLDTLVKRNEPGGGLEAYLRQLRQFLQDNAMLAREFDPGDIFAGAYIGEALEQLKPAPPVVVDEPEALPPIPAQTNSYDFEEIQ